MGTASVGRTRQVAVAAPARRRGTYRRPRSAVCLRGRSSGCASARIASLAATRSPSYRTPRGRSPERAHEAVQAAVVVPWPVHRFQASPTPWLPECAYAACRQMVNLMGILATRGLGGRAPATKSKAASCSGGFRIFGHQRSRRCDQYPGRRLVWARARITISPSLI